jgi:hypothetical protein
MIQEQRGYIHNSACNVRDDPEHSAFDPGWNKIFNITEVIREGIALPASSLALPGTTRLRKGSIVALLTQTIGMILGMIYPAELQ